MQTVVTVIFSKKVSFQTCHTIVVRALWRCNCHIWPHSREQERWGDDRGKSLEGCKLVVNVCPLHGFFSTNSQTILFWDPGYIQWWTSGFVIRVWLIGLHLRNVLSEQALTWTHRLGLLLLYRTSEWQLVRPLFDYSKSNYRHVLGSANSCVAVGGHRFGLNIPHQGCRDSLAFLSI